MAESPKKSIPCATCGTPCSYFEKPAGPFCSVRCQMVDLGKWLDEDYKISEPLTPDHLSAYEEMTGPELDLPEP